MTNSKKVTMAIGSILFIGAIIFITGCFNNSENISKGTIKEVSALDCGVSKSKFEEDYATDSALVCLGNAMLDDCKHSTAILDMEELGQVNVEVKKKGKECVGIMKFGDARQIQSKEYKSLINKDIECPLDFELFNQYVAASTTGPKITETPGRLAGTAFYFHIMSRATVYPKMECTGSVFGS